MIGTLQHILEDMKTGVYDYTDNGKCSSCGQCCSNYLPVSSKEIKEIRRYIEKKHIRECKHIIPTVEYFDMTCPFRDNDRKICTIYQHRPVICKDFKCDNAKHDIWAKKELYHHRYEVCDMRETFFGENKGKRGNELIEPKNSKNFDKSTTDFKKEL